MLDDSRKDHIQLPDGQPKVLASDMLDYYSRRAREYERIYHLPERQQDLARLRERLTGFFDGANVLELACGTGYWTEVIASTTRSILATDFSPEVLEVAANKAYPGGRVRFALTDAFDLGSLRGNFDAGFAGFWWSHVRRDDLRAFLRGFHARLEPGARVLFVDNRFVEGSSTPISRTDDAGNTHQQRKLDDGSSHEVLKNFPTRDDLHSAVVGIADDVVVNELTYFWTLSYRTARTGG